MKIYLTMFLFPAIIIASACNGQSGKKAVKVSDKVQHQNKLNNNVKFLDTGNFDSLVNEISCDYDSAVIEITQLESKIDSVLLNLKKQLQSYKGDTTRSNAMYNRLDSFALGYKRSVNLETELVFWSYGMASMQGERKEVTKCYYLHRLRQIHKFLTSINEHISKNMLELQ